MSFIISCLKFICEGVSSCLCKITVFVYRHIIKLKQTCPEHFELDINNVNNELIGYYYGEFGDTYCSKYVPCYSVRINKVKDGKQLIWESENSELSMVILRYRNVSRHIMYIVDTKGWSYYFILKDDSWNWITGEEYFNKTKELRLSTDIKEDIIVNTEVETPNKRFNVSEYQTCSTTQRSFVPRPGYRANKVVYGKETIWESADNTYWMTSGILLLSFGKPKLFNMRIVGETDEYLYFKKDCEWVEIDREEFRRVSEYYKSWAPFTEIIDTQDTIQDSFNKRFNLTS